MPGLETEELVLYCSSVLLGARGLLFVLVLGLLVELLKRNYLSTQVRDFLNQLLVLDHDVLVVLLVQHVFFFQPLLQLLVGTFEVLLLIKVLFLDVRVDVSCLRALSLNIMLQLFFDSVSYKVNVCDVLNDFVNCALETLDVDIILPNPGA